MIWFGIMVEHQLYFLRSDIIWTHSNINIKEIVNLGINKGKINLSYRGIDLRKLPNHV